MRVAIAGAGGHARVVADALLAALEPQGPNGLELVGFLDDDPRRHGEAMLGYPVLGPIASWRQQAVEALVVAIGDNSRRGAVFDELVAAGASLVNVLHPRVTFGQNVRLGRGVVAFANVVVNVDSTIGDDVILNTACSVDHDCWIGPHAHLAPGVRLAGSVRVGEGAFLGVGAAAIPGVSIGAWATVGAGAVVINDVRNGATVVGVPAREV